MIAPWPEANFVISPDPGGPEMPIHFHTSLDLDLAYSRWSGRVTVAAWRASFESYRKDAYFRPGRTKLNDLTAVTDMDADFNSLWSVLDRVNWHLREHDVRTRVVLIAPGELVYGLARIFHSLSQNADGLEVELHRDAPSALAALGLPFDCVDDLLEKGGFLPHTTAETGLQVGRR